ncbi:MAG: hypothetical protein ACM3SO_18690 [Betaproteobacteria bacterium]
MGAATLGGWVTIESGARYARAAGLVNAAGAGRKSAGARADAKARTGAGLVVGYLPGSAAILEDAAAGREWDPRVFRTRWTAWDASQTLPIRDPMASVTVGLMHRAPAPSAAELLWSLEMVAHYAIDGAPYFVAFPAWMYDTMSRRQPAKTTPPLTFDVAMPDRVALQVNYALVGGALASGVSSSGMVYLPLGSSDGPGYGLYVLAGPSRYTGTLPNLGEYRFSGDLDTPLLRSNGSEPDFDFVAWMVRQVRA